MADFRKHIEYLYPNHVEETLASIYSLIRKYSSQIQKETFAFSQKDVVLIAYADSFKSKNKTDLQTLHQVSKKYLKGLINTIHILPFYPFTSDDGFSVVDYKKVKPDFGDWKDINHLHEDFNLMFDAVINHISKSSDWFQGFLRGDKEFENFFIEENPDNKELNKVTRPRTLPLLHPFLKEGKETHIWTTFSEDQVDLNYSNPKVFLEVLEVLLFYVSKGAKMIRLDAIAFLWKKLGTTCIHLEETHKVIQLYRKTIEEVAPQTIIISETNVPHQENISYFGDGLNEAHMVYNFSLPPLLAYSLHTENIDVLTDWAQSLRLPSNKTSFFNFTASHDGIGVRPLQGIIADEEIHLLAEKAKNHGGFVSYKTNPDGSESPYELNCNYMDLLTKPTEDLQKRAKRFLLTQSVMLCFEGIPGVYYHSVFGSENDRNAAIQSGINRRINRAKIEFAELDEQIENKESLRSMVFSEYEKMLETRVNEIAFHPNAKTIYFRDKGIFIIERNHEGESILCLHNFTSTSVDIQRYIRNRKNITYWKDLKSTLEANAFIWLKSVS
jgi:sucrose phosphorylase